MKFTPIILFTLLLVTSTAHAQPVSVADLNAQGMQAFARGEYAEAAEIFGRAHAMEPRPELLKNAAVAWYKALRCDEAVTSATSYLRNADVQSEEARQMRSLVGACRVRLAQEAVRAGSFELAEELLAKAEAGAPDDALVARIDVLKVEIAKRRADEKAAAEVESVEVTPLEDVQVSPEEIEAEESIVVPPEPARRSPAGAILAVTGGAVLAGTIVYHLVTALSTEQRFMDVAEAGLDEEEYDRLDRSLRRANILVPLGYAIGAVTLATGVTVWIATSPGGDVQVAIGGTF